MQPPSTLYINMFTIFVDIQENDQSNPFVYIRFWRYALTLCGLESQTHMKQQDVQIYLLKKNNFFNPLKVHERPSRVQNIEHRTSSWLRLLVLVYSHGTKSSSEGAVTSSLFETIPSNN